MRKLATHDSGTPTSSVLSAVLRVAQDLRAGVAELDGLRSENEALRAQRDELLAALKAIGRALDRRWDAAAALTPSMRAPRAGRTGASAVVVLPWQAQHSLLGSGYWADVDEVGGLRIDRGSRSVQLHGRDVPLAPREFDLLSVLLAHGGQSLTHEQLLRTVWHTPSIPDTRTLRVYINAVRTKLERFGSPPIRIVTLHRIGYRVDRVEESRGP